MTQNQIGYWNYRETGRHNVETERETNRHNLATEGETNRHNLVTEGETSQHNRATEGLDLSKLQETSRHNMSQEEQARAELKENSRHNVAGEAFNLAKLDEERRHNQTQEGISSNSLLEQMRSNRANESLRGMDLSIAAGQLSEQHRHNTAQESVSAYQAKATAELQHAQTLYQDAKRGWEAILNAHNINLPQAQIDKINAEISNYDVLREKAEHDQSISTAEEVRKWAQDLWNAVKDVAPILGGIQ